MEIKSETKTETTFEMKLTEAEARALNAITVYGISNFLKFFYKGLGTYYLQPHEAGLTSLFDGIRTDLRPELNKAEMLVAAIKPKS